MKKGPHFSPSLIERMAESLKLIPNLHDNMGESTEPVGTPDKLERYPSPDKWDNWVEKEMMEKI